MRSVIITYKGEKYGMLYNGMAMFEMQDKYGDYQAMIEVLFEASKKGLIALAEAVEIMNTQYIAARVENGFDRPPTLTAKRILATASIIDFKDIFQQATLTAISSGLSREVEDENEEIDLGLLELEKKTDTP